MDIPRELYLNKEVSMHALELSPTVIDLSPRPVLTALDNYRVVRDDLLPGGTKQRASAPFIKDMMNLGFTHFVYASPFAGFAQVALSYACQMLNVSCTIVCEKDQRFTDGRLHPFSELARSYGARIVKVSNLAEAEEIALSIENNQYTTFKIPLGFDCKEFRVHLKTVIEKAFRQIENESGIVKRLWISVGSGTLLKTFLEALPERVNFLCVDVRVLGQSDTRIQSLKCHSRVEYFEAPMTFHTEARVLPDIPSNTFYDAKLWEFIKLHGVLGDVWWNVAR
jgi:hypothetical protein